MAFVEQKIAIEIEGGGWVGGRHHREQGSANDREKQNTAQLMGWMVLRVAPADFKGEAVYELAKGAMIAMDERRTEALRVVLRQVGAMTEVKPKFVEPIRNDPFSDYRKVIIEKIAKSTMIATVRGT